MTCSLIHVLFSWENLASQKISLSKILDADFSYGDFFDSAGLVFNFLFFFDYCYSLGFFMWSFGLRSFHKLVTIPLKMSRFPTSEALAFLEAFCPFFLSKLFDFDCINVHSIWVFWWLCLRVSLLGSVRGVNLSSSYVVCSFPLCFELSGPNVPVVNLGRNCIHLVDSFYKG